MIFWGEGFFKSNQGENELLSFIWAMKGKRGVKGNWGKKGKNIKHPMDTTFIEAMAPQMPNSETTKCQNN
jgi:hypothetical protein